ncbi:hypothetical protein Tco_0093798 [Tanacetum coccineum]
MAEDLLNYVTEGSSEKFCVDDEHQRVFEELKRLGCVFDATWKCIAYASRQVLETYEVIIQPIDLELAAWFSGCYWQYEDRSNLQATDQRSSKGRRECGLIVQMLTTRSQSFLLIFGKDYRKLGELDFCSSTHSSSNPLVIRRPFRTLEDMLKACASGMDRVSSWRSCILEGFAIQRSLNVFGIKGNLCPRFIGPFEILRTDWRGFVSSGASLPVIALHDVVMYLF